MAWGLANRYREVCLTVVVCLLLGGCVSAAVSGETSTVFIYLQVPASYVVPTELSLAELTISAGGQATALTPLLRHLSAGELAGRQVLLAKAELVPAAYDSLTVVLGGATVQSGVALVKPRVLPQGQAFAIHTYLKPDEAVVIGLVWHPGPAPEAGAAYLADLRVVELPVPPLGSLAFVTDQDAGCVMVVDRLQGRVMAAVRVGQSPRGMAYAAGAQKLYVAETDGVAVIDALTLRRERVAPMSFGDDPERLALSPDEGTLYVLNPGSRSLAALATRSTQEKYRVSVGDGPRSLAVNPVSGEVYVACEYEGEVQVFAAAGLQQQASLQLIASPVEVAFAENPPELFVTSRTQSRLQGIDFTSGRELGGQSLCGPAEFLAYSPRSGQLFAAIPSCQEVAVLRPAAGFEFVPLATPAKPGYLAFDPAYRQLLVLLPESSSLVILEASRGTLEHRVEFSGHPYAVLAP